MFKKIDVSLLRLVTGRNILFTPKLSLQEFYFLTFYKVLLSTQCLLEMALFGKYSRRGKTSLIVPLAEAGAAVVAPPVLATCYVTLNLAFVPSVRYYYPCATGNLSSRK